MTDKTKYEFKSIYTCIVKKNIQDVDLRYKNFKSCFWQSTLTQTYILCFIASVSRLIFQFPMYIKKNLLFCHRTQAIVLHHMFFNNYLEFSIACGNIFIPGILLWWNITTSWSRSMIVNVVRRRYNEMCSIMHNHACKGMK